MGSKKERERADFLERERERERGEKEKEGGVFE